MQDKYFKTTELKENIITLLGLDAPNTILGCNGNYFQTPAFILYWVGKIPIANPDPEAPIEYEADGAEHFNIRPITGYPDVSEVAEEINPIPVTPYAVFQ